MSPGRSHDRAPGSSIGRHPDAGEVADRHGRAAGHPEHARHHQALPGRGRPGGRLVRRPCGRGPRPGRRERRRQVHAHEDHERRLHRVRGRDAARRRAGVLPRHPRGDRQRRRHDPPGAEPGARADGLREHLPGPRAQDAARARSTGAPCAGRPRPDVQARAGHRHQPDHRRDCGSASASSSRSPRRSASTPASSSWTSRPRR